MRVHDFVCLFDFNVYMLMKNILNSTTINHQQPAGQPTKKPSHQSQCHQHHHMQPHIAASYTHMHVYPSLLLYVFVSALKDAFLCAWVRCEHTWLFPLLLPTNYIHPYVFKMYIRTCVCMYKYTNVTFAVFVCSTGKSTYWECGYKYTR